MRHKDKLITKSIFTFI